MVKGGGGWEGSSVVCRDLEEWTDEGAHEIVPRVSSIVWVDLTTGRAQIEELIGEQEFWPFSRFVDLV
jgi:hypothetical protein